MTYDLDALRAAALQEALNSSPERVGRLIALGLAVEAAAERDGPERETMARAAFRWIRGVCPSDEDDVEDVHRAMQCAARALIAMQEVR